MNERRKVSRISTRIRKIQKGRKKSVEIKKDNVLLSVNSV